VPGKVARKWENVLYFQSMSTTFNEMGFLASSVSDSLPAFATKFAQWVDLYYDLNRFALQQFHSIKVESRDLRGLLIYSCFYRTLATYQSAFLLIERGSDTDSKALLRNMVENLFVLVATGKDNTFAQEYTVVDESKRVNLLRNVVSVYQTLKHQKADLFITPRQVTEMQQEIDTYDKQKNDPKSPMYVAKGVKETVKVNKIAERAGLDAFYKQHYAYLCLFAHPSPNGMRDYLITNSTGEITDFKIGPNDNDAEANMRIAMVILLGALDGLAAFFKHDIKTAIDSFTKRLDEAIEQSYTQQMKV